MMSQDSQPQERQSKARRFVDHLERLATNQDRRALAALRRTLGKRPGEAAEAHRYILPFNPTTWDEPAYYMVAALFASHPLSWPTEDDKGSTNFGASFARLNSTTDSDSIERRFVALLDCHADDLGEHLRHAVSLLRSRDVPVDWVRLLDHLCRWNHEDRYVQREWARGFWGGLEPESSQPKTE